MVIWQQTFANFYFSHRIVSSSSSATVAMFTASQNLRNFLGDLLLVSSYEIITTDNKAIENVNLYQNLCLYEV